MLRRILVLILSLGSFCSVYSQVKFGVQAGVGLSDVVAVNPSQTASIVYTDDFYDLKPSITFGFSALFPFNERFALMPLLQYTNKGMRVRDNNSSDEFVDLSYVGLSPLVRYNLNSRFFFELGPEVAYLTQASVRRITNNDVIFYQRFDLGVNTGVGFDLTEKIDMGVRYYMGFIDIYDEANIPNSPPNSSGSGYYNRYAQLYGSFSFN
ncbi:MAG: porin family protein [Cyclobacteriaceae bacterium]